MNEEDMPATFSKMPPHMVEALTPIDEEIKALAERTIKAAFAAGEAHEKGSGHDATVSALEAVAIRWGTLTIARAAEVHDDRPILLVATVVTRDIGRAVMMTILQLFGSTK